MIKTILVFGAHADDAEFSCGGTIRRLVDEGATAWYVAFSPCNKSLPEGFPDGSLYDEMHKASVHLGIKEENIIKYDFPVRELQAHRQKILDEMINVRSKVKPDLIFVPSSNDVHQDHHQVYLEALRAFKFYKILGYEFPWNTFNPIHNVHFKLEKKHIDAKWASIQEYKSQQGRSYSDSEMVYGLARVRGRQCASEYAEGFEAIRWVM